MIEDTRYHEVGELDRGLVVVVDGDDVTVIKGDWGRRRGDAGLNDVCIRIGHQVSA